MRSMTNLEYKLIIKEIQDLVDKHFSKIWLVDGYYRMKIGDKSIVCEPGVRLHITKYIDKETEIDGFCQKIRKDLHNARVLSIEQLNNDRLVLFRFDKGELYLEMFGKGNMILVKDGNTVVSVKNETWSDREIKPGKEYKTPKSSVLLELEKAISDRYIIASLMKLPLGKQYAKELLKIAGVDEKTPGNKLEKKQIQDIKKNMSEMLNSLTPLVFYDNEDPIDFGLIRFSEYADDGVKEFPTVNEAVDEFYFKQKPEQNPESKKLEKRLEKQIEYLEEMKEKEKQAKEIGDYIYENFQEIEEILKTTKDQKQIEEKLKKYNVKLNRKEKTIEIDV